MRTKVAGHGRPLRVVAARTAPRAHDRASIAGNPDAAADVTQDVYLRVVRKLGGFRHEASFTTWLNRVTTNVAMSSLKRRTRRIAVEGAVVPVETRDPSPDPAERAEAVALARRLEQLGAGLPEGP